MALHVSTCTPGLVLGAEQSRYKKKKKNLCPHVTYLLVVLERGIDKKRKKSERSSALKNKAGEGSLGGVEQSCNAKWGDQSDLDWKVACRRYTLEEESAKQRWGKYQTPEAGMCLAQVKEWQVDQLAENRLEDE